MQRQNGASPVSSGSPLPTILDGGECREAERSEADRSSAPSKIVAVPPARPNPEVVADARRRVFTAEYKMRILAEADSARNVACAVGSLIRREGLYSSHLVAWRKQRDVSLRRALTPRRAGLGPKIDPTQVQVGELKRELARKDEALAKAELIIDIQKKVGMLLGWPVPPSLEGRS